ncbi:hypothetical protein [Acetivibrio sp. MSJd-27]|uniref:hypothetical protein n=1 Tax=Acetivibrio sp. MSJd-27 TaxID=2841523 RepID=UPI001C102F05|nr:hypothetical protein [Acetivibrio sp. MSJd-27]MBU5451474.1 hypothetical protein [Acetivibrio sp. MSJd-27]
MFARDVGEESFEYLKSELQDLMNTISEMKESGELDAIAEGLGSSIAKVTRSERGYTGCLWDKRLKN